MIFDLLTYFCFYLSTLSTGTSNKYLEKNSLISLLINTSKIIKLYHLFLFSSNITLLANLQCEDDVDEKITG